MFSDATDRDAVLFISQDPGIVTVVERFKVASAERDKAIEMARDAVSRTWKQSPLFIAAALFRGREHDGVSCYSQWRRSDDRFTPEAPKAAQSLAVALAPYDLQESRTFSMDFAEGVDADTPVIELSIAKSPHVHYGLFAVEPKNQNRVADLGRINSTQSIGAPGLLSINWHRSLDGHRIINLGLWENFSGLETLNKQDGFKPGEVYWDGYADWQGELFDVVAIVTRDRSPEVAESDADQEEKSPAKELNS